MRSDAVHFGRNRDLNTLRDDRQVRCSHCGFVCNVDRDASSNTGSRVGDGIQQAETQLNGAVTAGDTTITVDSTTGFKTPATSTITAYASQRLGTLVTSVGHGLTADRIIISGTTNYNGTWYISEVTNDTFVIGAIYVSDEATGTWIAPEFMYIFDVGAYATDEDVSSTYTQANGSPTADRVMYTGLSSTTFTGCVGALAHDDDMYVRSEPYITMGCPMCGKLNYREK